MRHETRDKVVSWRHELSPGSRDSHASRVGCGPPTLPPIEAAKSAAVSLAVGGGVIRALCICPHNHVHVVILYRD